jgi:hypothetical protein
VSVPSLQTSVFHEITDAQDLVHAELSGQAFHVDWIGPSERDAGA